MTLFEAIVVVAALVVAGAVAIANGSIEPVLAGLIGTVIGYAVKGVASSAPAAINRSAETPFRGAPDA